MKIAILGGGIAGLTAAFHLRNRAEVVVFEARARAGGNIHSSELDGCLVEWGPNGFLDNEPATLDLVAQLDLESHLLRARQVAARRFIWRQGALRLLPEKPQAFFTSDCLPLLGRLRAALEPLCRRAPEGDESVFDFARRHLGRSAAEVLVDAFVTGIFAGDPRRLSVRSALPKLAALQDTNRSLVIAARKTRRIGPPGTLTSFDGGLRVLIDRLASEVDLKFESAQTTVPTGFDRVICTVPAAHAAELVEPGLAEILRKIPTAPVAVIALVMPASIAVPDAFGFLVPRGQGLRILGTLYDSSIFAGRAPEGRRVFRVLLGGRHDPHAIDLSDDQIMEVVATELRQVWGSFPDPLASTVIRHRLGIAQYEVGHQRLLDEIEARRPPELFFGGSSYNGVALNACVKEGLAWSFD